MNTHFLAVLVPVAILVGACSSAAANPTWTFGPDASTPSRSPVAVVSPTDAPATPPPSEVPATPAPAKPAPATPAPAKPALSGEVAVTMTDAMRFEPASLTVKAGEPITFVVKNAGVIVHEFFVGSESEQVEHAAEMAMGAMSHGHDNALSVPAGQTDTLTRTFDEAGALLIGCHEPGHFEAGMVGTLTVVD